MINDQFEQLRRQACDMIKNVQSSRGGHKKTWRTDFKWRVASLVLSTKIGKNALLSRVKEELKNKWPEYARDIEKIKPKQLLEKVQSVTYEFLKELKLDTNPGDWDLDKEVTSAYKIFRFKDFDSDFKTWCKWLNKEPRRQKLTSIAIPCTGICVQSSS